MPSRYSILGKLFLRIRSIQAKPFGICYGGILTRYGHLSARQNCWNLSTGWRGLVRVIQNVELVCLVSLMQDSRKTSKLIKIHNLFIQQHIHGADNSNAIGHTLSIYHLSFMNQALQFYHSSIASLLPESVLVCKFWIVSNFKAQYASTWVYKFWISFCIFTWRCVMSMMSQTSSCRCPQWLATSWLVYVSSSFLLSLSQSLWSTSTSKASNFASNQSISSSSSIR